ncbi:MAG TPA: M14 family zinc carboxypeptidase [Terriglobales bacterium]|nr:M14 family zinc carboxypeptidase [Terriglobales bacterium]
MNRREWLRFAVSGLAAIPLWAKQNTDLMTMQKIEGSDLSNNSRPTALTPNSQLSTRGRFLNWSPEEERYWFFSARDGLDRFRRLAETHRGSCDFTELTRSATGLPIYEFRLGKGPKTIAIMSGMHGCEPTGPRGLLAYLDSLLNASKPFDAAVNAKQILEKITLHVFPLVNPGGAQRFSEHFPDSWHGTWIPEWTAENKDKFFAEGNEPNHFFYGTYVKKAPMRFTPDQIAKWEATGNVLGSSVTDDGLDMWFDWDDTHGRQTLALKEVLQQIRPAVFADFHNFMYPTEVFAPTVYSTGALAQEETELALAMQRAWTARNLQFHDRPPRPYTKPSEKYYEDYWVHQIGARTLIVEFNGGMLATEGAEYEPVPGQRALTRRESLASAFFAVDALVNRALELGL